LGSEERLWPGLTGTGDFEFRILKTEDGVIDKTKEGSIRGDIARSDVVSSSCSKFDVKTRSEGGMVGSKVQLVSSLERSSSRSSKLLKELGGGGVGIIASVEFSRVSRVAETLVMVLVLNELICSL